MFWGTKIARLPAIERLNAEESALYDDLRFDRIAPSLRLERERIGFAWIKAELARAGLK
jgi:hypothetical protein